MSERPFSIRWTAAAVFVALMGLGASAYAALAIAPSALVLLVDAPFDATGEVGGMLVASACALIVPAPLSLIAIGLTIAKRPLPAIALGFVAIVIAVTVGTWIGAYFHEERVVAADASALGRPCASSAACPAGYQCVGTIGTGEHCEIPCGSPPVCPAGTTCTNVDVIGPHCR